MAQALPPSISGTLIVGNYNAHGQVTPAVLQQLLYGSLIHPLKLIFGADSVTVRDCADWPNYTPGYEVDEGSPPSWRMTADDKDRLTCIVVFFLENSASGDDRLNPPHPLSLADAKLIPANILPTQKSIIYNSFTVPEYDDYKSDGTSIADLAATGDISLSTTFSGGQPSIHITCITDSECGRTAESYPCQNDPKCGENAETLTEIARGDFLRTGNRQILVRADYRFPDAEQAYGYGYGSFYLLFNASQPGKPYVAYLFSPGCSSSAVRNNAATEPVPCVTGWPDMPPPEPPTIPKTLAFEAGFNCAEAATPLEHLVCTDKGLAAQDSELNALYQYATANLDPVARTTLRDTQRQWLKARLSICQLPAKGIVPSGDRSNAVACISAQYTQRIRELLPHYTVSTTADTNSEDHKDSPSALPIDVPGAVLPHPAFAKDGAWYVTSEAGGATSPSCQRDSGNDCGAIVRLQKSASGTWSESIIYAFQGGETGGEPDNAQLAIGPDGSLYGTTLAGGGSVRANGVPCQCGVVFRLSPPSKGETVWRYDVLHSFAGYPGDGKVQGWAHDQPLTLGPSGEIFGATKNGGPRDAGVVFELIPAPLGRDWPEAILFSFEGQTGMPEGITDTADTPLTDDKGTLTFPVTLGNPGSAPSYETIKLTPDA